MILFTDNFPVVEERSLQLDGWMVTRFGGVMIKNIVFDIGKVLVDFDWESYFDSLCMPPEIYEEMADATVRSKLWNEFDRGALPEDEILAAFLAAAPNCKSQVIALWNNLGECIKRYDYSMEWIETLKNEGYNVYFLSNYPFRIYEQSKEQLAFIEKMDGGIFSYQIKFTKPEPEIFTALFEKYNLKPEECVFLDDNQRNVEAAQELGMNVIQFTEYEKAAEELKHMGVGK